jgi:hypothetical protein
MIIVILSSHVYSTGTSVRIIEPFLNFLLMLQQDKLVCLFPSYFVECLGEGLELTLKAWGSEMTPWHTLA